MTCIRQNHSPISENGNLVRLDFSSDGSGLFFFFFFFNEYLLESWSAFKAFKILDHSVVCFDLNSLCLERLHYPGS